jgi:solute carrier family 25 folate transporter 32
MDASTLHNLIAGFGAGSASSLITCPLDVTKTRLQNQSLEHRHYSGTFRTLRIIYAEEGIRGLYRGLGATMLGYQPAWAIYFTTYHKFKIVFARNLRLPADNSNVHILSAMCAGALANASTNPFWVIKTRLITQSSQSAFHYRSILHAFSTIYHEEGIKGFYRGLGASLLGVGHVMIQFPVYEKAKKETTRDSAQKQSE